MRYPPIAANSPMTMLPEQAANWAYPQPDMDDEEIVFTVTTSLAGTFYLSGHVDRMNAHQMALVQSGVEVAKALRSDLTSQIPWWPKGLAGWDDEWVVTGRRKKSSRDGVIIVWHRPSTESTVLDLPDLAGTHLEPLYPPACLVPDPGIHIADSSSSPRLNCPSPKPTGRVFRVRDLHDCVTDVAEMEKK